MGRIKRVGWHLEVKQAKVSGKLGYFWCAVDQDGEVLDVYFTATRDEDAALAFFRRVLTKSKFPGVAAARNRGEAR